MIKVYKIRDILKVLIGIVSLLIVTIVLIKFFLGIDIGVDIDDNKQAIAKEIGDKKESYSKTFFKYCLDVTIPLINYETDISKEEENKNTNKYKISSRDSSITRLLDMELGMMKTVEDDDEDIYFDHVESGDSNISAASNLDEAQTGLNTQIVDESGINTKYTNTYGSINVKNESKYELTEEILNPNIELSNKKDIILFHTHTCESYTPSDIYQYEQTGNFRTTDLNYSVARVGTELKNYLTQYGYNVTHDTTYHDYPAYSGSYNRSLTTVQNLLSANSTTQVVFDIHRDAVGSNSAYAPTVKIGEDYAAQLMFVIGTNGGGLEHNNWIQNLKFAIKIQEKANELYPGLFKPIILRNSRYNQHLTTAANIIEVGATGNTLDQCLTSMKYLSKVIDEVLK